MATFPSVFGNFPLGESKPSTTLYVRFSEAGITLLSAISYRIGSIGSSIEGVNKLMFVPWF